MTTSASDRAHTPAYDAPTLITCDAEPIHIPGAIQPHGVLLATEPDQTIVVASANLAEMFGVGAQDAIGRRLGDVVGERVDDAVLQALAEGFPHEPRTPVLDDVSDGRLAGHMVDVRVHTSQGRTIVEIESLADGDWASKGRSSSRSARGSLARLAQGSSVASLADLLAREVRELSGFDRVMIYRFDEMWNGEVVAEAKRADLNPFLGLHYPATDIPAQARRLYEINPIRLIADIFYSPVPLLPTFDPVSGAPLDMSHASLRSVSPIHVEYLSNMGVTASMSVSIMIDDVLWGLVACHHYSGFHCPSQEARASSEFVTQAAAALISSRERAEAREAQVQTHQRLSDLYARVSATDGNPLDALIADPDLLRLVGGHGVLLHFDGNLRSVGDVPPHELAAHIAAITFDPEHYVSATGNLAALDPALAAHAEVAAGVMRIGAAPDRFLMWFRPEQPQVVDWGGDPSNKRLAETADPAVRLSPRKSFEKWQETTRGHSEPWEPWHLEAADALGRQLNALLLTRAREQIAMAESMQRTVVLDQVPLIPGVELVARYQSASTYQLGGDWWDAFEVGDRVALVVGDVAGHGVAAASAMTQLRAALRAYLYEGHDAATSLHKLDLLLDGLLGLGIATAVVALLDPRTGDVELAAAGHPMPLLLRRGLPAELLTVESRPLLGVGEGSGVARLFRLDLGDGLLLYTDGLIERRGQDLDVCLERLRLASGWQAGEDVEALADRLVATFGSPEDDTTLLVLRRDGI